MASFKQLSLDYRELSSGEGATTALQLSNALLEAERLESNRHWGIFQGSHELKIKARLKAWQMVKDKREALDEIIHVRLFSIVQRMRDASPPPESLQKFESDIVLKSGILFSLGGGNLNQEETFALLAAWAASPMEKD